MSPEYVKPSDFYDKQIIGRAIMSTLRDNDDYFNALADRWRPIPAGARRYLRSDESDIPVWDGYHLLNSDATTLQYTIHSDGGPTVTLYYDYGGGNQQTIATTSSGTATGTYDLTGDGFSSGFYRVYCRAQSGSAGWATCRCPFTLYTGDYSYTTPPTITDGATSAVADFNKWVDNDVYFNEIKPAQVAATGFYCSDHDQDGTGIIGLFAGWDRFREEHARIYYKMWVQDAGTPLVRLYYDYGGGEQQYTDITSGWDSDGNLSSYWDLDTVTYSYTNGTPYWVRAEQRSDSRGVRLDYLFVTAASADADYTVMDPFTVNQWVYGSTAGQDTRLDLLSDNDAAIYARLAYSAAVERQDFACLKPQTRKGTRWYWGDYLFRRMGTTLYYRTKAAELVLPGGETESLTDYDDDNDYQTLNLNTIDLPHGAEYRIRLVDDADSEERGPDNNEHFTSDRTLDFAMEV